MIKLETEICADLAASASREWLETNGIGGYASSTISGANTRRYHGLLIAATHPPLGRLVLLSKLEETLIVDGVAAELSANFYPGKIHPAGFNYIKDFRLDPFPIWNYDVAGVALEKRVFMEHGSNLVYVEWSVKSGGNGRKISLEVRPMLAFRNHHHLRHDESGISTAFEADDAEIVFKGADEVELHLSSNSIEIVDSGHWYYDLQYPIEKERGFEHSEQLYQPCLMRFDLADEAQIAASTAKCDHKDLKAAARREMKRRAALIAASGARDSVSRQLVLAADQFIVARGSGKTVIAGYPWFADWGRDSMIALNGLTLTANRPDDAKSILLEFSHHISDGMLPNRFPDEGETPDYNTVDATLWFFEAIRAYGERTGDFKFIRESLYEKLLDIIHWHVRGTRFNIHVDTDGLLCAGTADTQLTWMDAKIGDWVVTPRTGKCVEIQALWYNALCIVADLAGRFDDAERAKRFADMAGVAKESFNGQFWNADGNCLFDVIDGDRRDASIRPNQILAVSLPYSILSSEKARAVVDVVERELLTPYGLRSLARGSDGYAGLYIGSPLQRDAAYHQGTVWGWLIGPFIDAYRSVHADDADVEKYVAAMLEPFKSHLTEALVGQVSEIFDAESPNTPRGAPAQAWSVAELLRVIHKQ